MKYDVQSASEPSVVAAPSTASGGGAVEQSAYVFAAQVFGLCCGLASNILLAWMLGPAGKGSFYLVQLASSLGLVFLNFGLGPAAVYYLKKEKLHSETEVRSVIALISLLLGALPLLITAILWPRLESLGTGKLTPILILLAMASVPGLVVLWNVSYLKLAEGAVASFNIFRIAPSLLFLLFLAALLISKQIGIAAVTTCWLAATCLPALAVLFASMRGVRFQELHWVAFAPRVFRFGFYSHLGAVTQFLQHRVDALIVGYFCTLGDLGRFSLAVSIAELIWHIPNTVASVLISHIAQRPEEDGKRLTAGFCRVCLAITALLAVILAALGTWLIPIVLPAFRASVYVLWLLLPGTVSVTIFKVLAGDLNGRGHPQATFRPAATALAASFIGGIIVVPRFGIPGAAVVTSAGYVLNALLHARTYSRITAVPIRELLLLRFTDLLIIQGFWSRFRGVKIPGL